jgi:hypothetical protein
MQFDDTTRVPVSLTDDPLALQAEAGRALAPSWTDPVVWDPMLRRMLVLAVASWTVLSLACVFLITNGSDEAGVLLGVQSLIVPANVDYTIGPVFSNGGLLTPVHLAIEVVVGNQVWVHRSVSWICLAVVLAGLFAGALRRGASRSMALLALAPLLGLTGTAEVCTAAWGTSLAFLLLLVAAQVWGSQGDTGAGLGRAVLAGLLFGLAASARSELIVFPLAVLLLAFVRLRPNFAIRARFPWPELVLVLLGLAVFAANMIVHRLLTAEFDAQAGLSLVGMFASKNGEKLNISSVFLLNKWMIGEAFLAVPWLLLASVVPFWVLPGEDGEARSPQRRFAMIVLLMGWGIWLWWHINAPIAFLRYIWIGLACFAVLLGDGLERLYRAADHLGLQWVKITCLLVAIVFVGSGTATTLRSVVMGDQDAEIWEWQREMRIDFFRRFEAIKSQQAVMAYIRDKIPASEEIVTASLPFTMRYLTGRPVVVVSEFITKPAREDRKVHLVLTPMYGLWFFPRRPVAEWLETHARLEAEWGRYSLYEVSAAELVRAGPEFKAIMVAYEGHPLSSPWYARSFTRPLE